MSGYLPLVGLSATLMLRLPIFVKFVLGLAILWRIIFAALAALAVCYFLLVSRSELSGAISLSLAFLITFGLVLVARLIFLGAFFHDVSTLRGNLKSSSIAKSEVVFVSIVGIFTASVLSVEILRGRQATDVIATQRSATLSALTSGSRLQIQGKSRKDAELLGVINEFASLHRLGLSVNEANVFRIDRRALVVANSEYMGGRYLPGVDADLLKVPPVLELAGYDVTLISNKSFEETNRLVRNFIGQTKETDLIVFYLAGHGFQSFGSNYLEPVRYDDPQKQKQGLSHNLNEWYTYLLKRNPHFSFFVLDACREVIEDGEITKLKSFSTLVPPSQASYISITSTSPGYYANDFFGGDCADTQKTAGKCQSLMSPFASEFVSRFSEDGLIQDLPEKIRVGVIRRIEGARDSFTGDPKDGPVDQIPEIITRSRAEWPIRHLSPDSSLVSYSISLADSPHYNALRELCPGEASDFIFCIEELRKTISSRIEALKAAGDSITMNRSAVYNFFIQNQSDLSSYWREITQKNRLQWFLLTTLILLIACIDLVLCHQEVTKRSDKRMLGHPWLGRKNILSKFLGSYARSLRLYKVLFLRSHLTSPERYGVG